MTDAEAQLADVIIDLAEARRKRLALEERHPFFCLTPEQQQAVLRLNHTPHTREEIEDILTEALPGVNLATYLQHIGGQADHAAVLRIESTYLSLRRGNGMAAYNHFTVALPAGV